MHSTWATIHVEQVHLQYTQGTPKGGHDLVQTTELESREKTVRRTTRPPLLASALDQVITLRCAQVVQHRAARLERPQHCSLPPLRSRMQRAGPIAAFRS